ncbi:MAG: carboxymuconolactone decarboxylase family protein [Candidatus Kapaibacterium sp.]
MKKDSENRPDLLADFESRRTSGNEKILGQDFLPFKRFMALDSRAYEDDSIPAIYKELMGLVGSMVLRCNDCILYHIGTCHELGASRRELNEAMNIALVIGGSIVIPHLRFALEAVDALYSDSGTNNQ